MNKFFLCFFIFLISFLKTLYSDEILIESEELIITNEPLTTTFIGNVYAFDNEIKLLKLMSYEIHFPIFFNKIVSKNTFIKRVSNYPLFINFKNFLWQTNQAN